MVATTIAVKLFRQHVVPQSTPFRLGSATLTFTPDDALQT